jgi:hypothetical protein
MPQKTIKKKKSAFSKVAKGDTTLMKADGHKG